jgi:hypothetical protein
VEQIFEALKQAGGVAMVELSRDKTMLQDLVRKSGEALTALATG